MDVGDVAFEPVLHQFRRSEFCESNLHVLRLGFSAADHRKFHDGAGITAQQELRLLDAHLTGGEAGDFFKYVANLQAGFLAGAIGQR